jgi:hypothetical protein
VCRESDTAKQAIWGPCSQTSHDRLAWVHFNGSRIFRPSGHSQCGCRMLADLPLLITVSNAKSLPACRQSGTWAGCFRFADDARKEPNAVLNMTHSDHAQDCHGRVIGLAAV